MFGLNLASFFVSAALAATVFYIVDRHSSAMDLMQAGTTALRQQSDADMAHDAIRGTVYRSLHAAATKDGSVLAEVGKEFDEYAEVFQSRMGRLEKADLGPEIAGAVAKVKPSLLDYVKTARSIVEFAAKGDPAKATASLPAFDKAFKLLEDEMEALSDRIEAANTDFKSLADEAAFYGTIAKYVGLVAAVLISAILAFVANRRISGPIGRLTRTMRALSDGDLAVAAEGADRKDEIGDMARAVAVFRDSMVERSRLEEAARLEQDKRDAERRELERIILQFQADIGHVTENLGTEMHRMEKTADTLGSVARVTASQASAAAAASTESSAGIQTIASATEEMGASIGEIADRATKASGMVLTATETAERTNRDMAALAETARQIGTVVEMIRGIAEQTNLLALNATIEAARAGTAGRGFAVVASEVKSLAEQTAKATGDIAQQVGAIQSAARATEESVRGIVAMMENVNGLTASIATSVSEQSNATREITANITQASQGSSEVAGSVESVMGAVAETEMAAASARGVAEKLSQITDRLSKTVEDFLGTINGEIRDRRGARRLQAARDFEVQHEGRVHRSRMTELSTTGARLGTVPGISAGSTVRLRLTGELDVSATVIWLTADEFGVRFARPISDHDAAAVAGRAAA
ncbi:methyl-accepting chemotaxis protein [Prosthecomicrobium sp. N25]|uniref:methyl-accepting chemotaxis protein n=1 Tax=Prosthecomicrobium sp. N25 TaxID=3129254 RepID=UPI003077AD76